MATVAKTSSNTGKAVVCKRGWPMTIKTFCSKLADWARTTEDEVVCGLYTRRAGVERLLFDKALDR